jgi:hypothetical protein
MRHEPSLVTLVLLWLRLDTTGGGMCPHTPLPCHELTICGERGTHDPLHLSLILNAAIVLLLNSLLELYCMLFGLFGGISPAHSKFSPFDRSVEILGPPQPQPRLITPLARFS